MRIALLHGYGLRGSGSAIYTRDFAMALCRAGHQVHLICHEHDPAWIQTLGAATSETSWGLVGQVTDRGTLTIYGLASARIPVAYPRPEIRNGVCWRDLSTADIQMANVPVLRRLCAVHRRHQLEYVLVNHLALLPAVAAEFQRRTRVPFAVISHGTGLHFGVEQCPPVRSSVLEALPRAKAVIALNESVRERLQTRLGSSLPKTILTPPGVDTEQFYLADQANHAAIGKTAPQLAYVGRLTMDKGVHCLLAMAPLLWRQVPSLRISIGGNGADTAALRAAGQALLRADLRGFREICVVAAQTNRSPADARRVLAPLDHFLASVSDRYLDWATRGADQLTWLGELDRPGVADVFRDADVAVLPSILPEAYPLVISEAIRCGAVPVGPDCAGTADVLQQLEAEIPELRGRLRVNAEPTSFVRSMAGRCLQLLQHPPSPAAVTRASQVVGERRSWSAVVTSLLDELAPARPELSFDMRSHA